MSLSVFLPSLFGGCCAGTILLLVNAVLFAIALAYSAKGDRRTSGQGDQSSGDAALGVLRERWRQAPTETH